MNGACVLPAGMFTDGEWAVLQAYITSQGFDGTEGMALKSGLGNNNGNGTDDWVFGPSGRLPRTAWLLFCMPASFGFWQEFVSQSVLRTGTCASTIHSSAGTASAFHVADSPCVVLGMPSERSEGGLTL